MNCFFVGTYTRNLLTGKKTGSQGIYLCSVEKDGTVHVRQTYNHIENPSFLAWNPKMRLLAAASEQIENSAVTLYRVAPDYTLTRLDRLETYGMACCHVTFSPRGDFLAGVHYGTGEVFVADVLPEGRFGTRFTLFRHSGKGGDPQRQEGPHAHSVHFLKNVPRAFVCDLGIDRIIPYDPDDIQGLRQSATDPIALPAKSGPRHMEFTRDERWLYVVCELANTVLVYELFDKTPQLRQKLSTLPDGYEGENLAADLHLSSDEKHLYVSNRGHDSLAHFTVGEDHRLRLAGYISCHGRGPRNFAIMPPFIMCANQNSDNVTILRCTPQGGATYLGEVKIPSPVCIAVP